MSLYFCALLGTDSNILTCLATCFPDFFATSAYDEPLWSIFSGALSKIHCSSLLSKLQSSCIFKAGYSTLSLYFGARFGADSNILTCLATCFSDFNNGARFGTDSNILTCLATSADFFATCACDEPLQSVFSGALSKIHCYSLLSKLHSSCIFKAGYSTLSL